MDNNCKLSDTDIKCSNSVGYCPMLGIKIIINENNDYIVT